MTAELTPSAGLYSGFADKENGWGDRVNANWLTLELLSVPFVNSAIVTLPPDAPADGDRYIIPSAAIGLWSGRTGQIVIWMKNQWNFFDPKKGWTFRSLGEAKTYQFNGTTWGVYLESISPEVMAKINAAIAAGVSAEADAQATAADRAVVLLAKNETLTARDIAATSANNALASKNAAQTARDQAVAAKTDAQTARDSAVAAEQVASYAAQSLQNSVSSSAANAAAAQAAATSAVNAWNSLDDRYLGPKATPPATDNGGDPLLPGALYLNTTDGLLYIFSNGVWNKTTPNSAINVQKTVATEGQTVFTAPQFTAGSNTVSVFVNGVRMYLDDDYTEAVNGLSITLNAAASAGDVVLVHVVQTLAFGSTAANLVTASDGASGSLFTTVAGFITRLMSSAGAALVGFLQKGLGAVFRYLQDKLYETISVKDFGAIGDGNSHPLSTRFATLVAAQAQYPFVTSLSEEIDGVAIQAAINSRTLGGNVFAPEGQYLATKQIRMRTGVRLFGEGYWNGSALTREGVTSIYALHTDPAIINMKGAIGCGLQEISLQGSQTNKPKTGLLLGRTSSASAGYHRISRVSICGWFTVAAIYTIASEDNVWEDVLTWNFGGDAPYGLVTGTTDVFNVDGLVASTNLNNVFYGLKVINTCSLNSSAGLYFEGAEAMGNWGFFGGYLTQYAGAYIRINNGAVDGKAMFGPLTFCNVSGEPLEGGNPLIGIDLTAPVSVNFAGLTIKGSRFQLAANGDGLHYDIRQGSNVTLVQPNIVIQPPEAFPYANSDIDFRKVLGGVVSVGRNYLYTDATLASGWTNTYGSPYAKAGYRVSQTGQVKLRGTVSGSAPSLIFTLPTKYCPAVNMFFPVFTNGQILGQVLVNISGAVTLVSGAAAVVDLNSISFDLT